MGADAASGDGNRGDALMAEGAVATVPAASQPAESTLGDTVLRLSIVICTWNRADMLADTVRSVAACRRDAAFEAEIIVVDNASSDHTARVLDTLEQELTFTRLFEPRSGLSIARNAGVDRAQGEWVIFLDDDVLLPPDFLVNYARAIRTLPDVAFIAGGVIAHFDGEVAPWVRALCDEQWWCFSAMVLQARTGELTAAQSPYGANMAVRRDVLAQFRFSDDLGFRHGVLIPGEETELFRRIRDAGYRGYWVDDVSLRHRLPAQRRKLGYLMKRAWGQGVADAMQGMERRGRSVPLWVPKDVVFAAGQTAGRAIVGNARWACALVRMTRGLGHLRTLLRSSPMRNIRRETAPANSAAHERA